ncbi:MAG: aspartate aminotransferase family protein [bacterium]|nr:aspartate aminotransferase family protein [bacterium]
MTAHKTQAPTTDRSAELFEQAREVLAGGVSRNTLLRAPHPIYAERASGCRIVDVDGVERIDFANNMAALIHGHSHPAVTAAVTAQLEHGTAYTMATRAEIDYALQLRRRAPGFEKMRFMNSGTEAVMAAMKASRAYTGRHKIAKVEGTYHGGYDYAEVSQAPAPHNWGPAERPASVPLAKGTPESVLQEVVVLPYNDPEAAVAVLNEHRGEIACVVLDLMPHRLGLIPAKDAYVVALRDWTREDGALLVLDEVITFRTEVGGMQTRYGVSPDLTAMGKVIGGGLPVGALAGRAEVMEVFSAGAGGPRLPQSGTFSANPLTITAGAAAMKLYDAEAVARMNRLGTLARARIEEAIAVAGAPASVTGAGSMFRIHMKAEAPTDYRSSYPSAEEKALLSHFVDGLYDHGVMAIHTGAGALSTPMDEAVIDQLADAVLASLRKL